MAPPTEYWHSRPARESEWMSMCSFVLQLPPRWWASSFGRRQGVSLSYASSSDRLGIPPFRAKPGDRVSLEFSFIANLTRGLYAVEVDVYDLQRQTQVAVMRRKPFSITEGISQFGMANLYPACHEVDAVAIAPEAACVARVLKVAADAIDDETRLTLFRRHLRR